MTEFIFIAADTVIADDGEEDDKEKRTGKEPENLDPRARSWEG